MKDSALIINEVHQMIFEVDVSIIYQNVMVWLTKKLQK